MKVVCISCFDYYATRMKSILDYFSEEGFETTYIISDFQHFSKKRFQVDYTNTIQVQVPEYRKNLSVQRLYSHKVFSDKVERYLKETEPDVIYCIIPPNLLVKKIAEYKKGHQRVKVIFDCYDLWPESFPYERFEKLLKFPLNIWKNLRDDYMDSGDLLLCVSDEVKMFCEKKFPYMPIKVLKPSIDASDLPQYSFNIKKELSFCYLGNINHITDIDLGIELLSKLSKEKKINLHIIGDGKNLDEFVNNLEKNQIEVIKHGVVFDSKTKKAVFEQCNFGLNIPRAEIHSSMSLKSVEYMSVGLPIINAGEGDNFEIVENEKIGINIKRDKLQETVSDILNLTEKDLINMHNQCVKYYKEVFLNQDLNELFSGLLKI